MTVSGKVALHRPVLLLMVGAGAKAAGWKKKFPADSYKMWEVDIDQPSSRFDVTDGEVDALLAGRLDEGDEDLAGNFFFHPAALAIRRGVW